MSWFDTSGFASLAKTALKEAQKTIDKALDIKDEDRPQPTVQIASTSSDFFDTWGVVKEGHTDQDKDSSMNQKQASTSVWGSFTGSFFENPKGEMQIVTSSKCSEESLEGSIENIDRLQASLISSKSFPESLSSKSLVNSAITQSPADPDFSLITSKSSDNLEESIGKGENKIRIKYIIMIFLHSMF